LRPLSSRLVVLFVLLWAAIFLMDASLAAPRRVPRGKAAVVRKKKPTPTPSPSATPQTPAQLAYPGASPSPVALTEALSEALARNPTMTYYLSLVQQTRWEISQAYLEMNPTFTVSTTYFRTLQPSGQTTTNPFVTFLNRVFHASLNATSSTIQSSALVAIT